MKGRVVKIVSGRYSVDSGGAIYECTARGTLRIKSCGIVVGDFVNFDPSSLTVESVLERKSFFLRPNIANLDAVNIVVANPPKPDFSMIDKLLLSVLHGGVQALITVNKTEISDNYYDEVYSEYKDVGCPIFKVSAHTGEGLDGLKKAMSGKLVAFAGQSAVGKSSLLNALFGLQLRTGEVSDKTLRGRHTTTASRIYTFGDIQVADTPGFSAVKPDILPEEAALFYPEYFALLPNCRYRGCLHVGEPGCAVAAAVRDGRLSAPRYARYKTIIDELKNKHINKYYGE